MTGASQQKKGFPRREAGNSQHLDYSDKALWQTVCTRGQGMFLMDKRCVHKSPMRGMHSHRSVRALEPAVFLPLVHGI